MKKNQRPSVQQIVLAAALALPLGWSHAADLDSGAGAAAPAHAEDGGPGGAAPRGPNGERGPGGNCGPEADGERRGPGGQGGPDGLRGERPGVGRGPGAPGALPRDPQGGRGDGPRGGHDDAPGPAPFGPGFGGPAGFAHAPGGPRGWHGIELNEAQEDKVFAILHAGAPYLREQGKIAAKARQALQALAKADKYDDAKAAALAREAAQAQANIALQHVRTEQKLLAVLTPEQRKQLAEDKPQHPPRP
jgi:Spy/CpxP family protein refolding chaperone